MLIESIKLNKNLIKVLKQLKINFICLIKRKNIIFSPILVLKSKVATVRKDLQYNRYNFIRNLGLVNLKALSVK